MNAELTNQLNTFIYPLTVVGLIKIGLNNRIIGYMRGKR